MTSPGPRPNSALHNAVTSVSAALTALLALVAVLMAATLPAHDASTSSTGALAGRSTSHAVVTIDADLDHRAPQAMQPGPAEISEGEEGDISRDECGQEPEPDERSPGARLVHADSLLLPTPDSTSQGFVAGAPLVGDAGPRPQLSRAPPRSRQA